jgi:radical S-adenosyl methionine domain-containing protein 2
MHGPALPAVNYHLIKGCNDRCTFCFATFREVRGHLPLPSARRLLDLLAEAGTSKLNFAGGEPTLHPHLPELIRHAKRLGMTTSIVTNGARLPRVLAEASDALDWVALSIDSADEATQAALGRGTGTHVQRTLGLAARVRAHGPRLKVNTVVTALNDHEDMSALIATLRPERWKVFQVLPVDGQNDGSVEPLLLSRARFEAFVERHRPLESRGIVIVPEDNDAMTDSYAMIDPQGRFYGNTDRRLQVSEPIPEVGVAEALAQAGFQRERLIARGGVYAWDAAELPATSRGQR